MFGNKNTFNHQSGGSWVDSGEIDDNGNPVYEMRPAYPVTNFDSQSTQQPEVKICTRCGTGNGWVRETSTGRNEPFEAARSYPCTVCNKDGKKR
jgi:hypothetical protein